MQAEALLAEARARAASITAAADERIGRRRSDALEAHERERRAAAELAVARSRRAARARLLAVRAGLLERVFAAATARLPDAAAGPAFRAELPARLAAARAALGDGPATLRGAPSLLATLRQMVKEGDGVAVRADPVVATGFVLASCDGALEIDETLATRLARRRQELALEIMRAIEADA
jgi:vacuolar-type H+-ATPase subunit E/Vma4